MAHPRMLSVQGGSAVRKLQQVMEEYRMQNYSQEMPSRFKKEVVRAAKSTEMETVPLEGLERVLHNIGAAHKISPEDLQVIFSELGEGGGIPADRMVTII
eukprot:CAMPEP_0202482430 /NCGR_PEP_ID=MMETSP1361-20130828/1835_1 /ASSEMBLY_ACC=CAM_ASM_000849 /TAXON_ID=210615 /ORGANISM="Staurosira complex sp., Strain CCMP2646" /LENGTH=99 /DNA_ID=CAMNT_0049110297 /DNA_START=86 /DNA_END=385 /DNA_ORIENTATION=-